LRYETAEISLVGHREQNQDRVAVVRNESTAFLIVVDGMGGHAQGERAAVVARESFIRSFDEASGDVADPQLFISEAISRAHDAVSAIGEGRSVEHKPRATCAICLVIGGDAWWGHVGDSRVYVLRDGTVLNRTRDHSHVELLLREGLISEDEIPGHPMRHYVECCLGGESALPRADSDATARNFRAGDTLLVCSDGLWSGVSDDVIGETSRATADISEWLDMLSENAVAANAPYSDNTSAAALRFIVD
jgi:serine/threonine protein phosphatase PrpC